MKETISFVKYLHLIAHHRVAVCEDHGVEQPIGEPTPECTNGVLSISRILPPQFLYKVPGNISITPRSDHSLPVSVTH